MSWWVGSVIIWENKTGSRPSLQHVKDDDGIFDEHTTLTGGTIGYGAALPNTSVTPHTVQAAICAPNMPRNRRPRHARRTAAHLSTGCHQSRNSFEDIAASKLLTRGQRQCFYQFPNAPLAASSLPHPGSPVRVSTGTL
eukprot:m.805769 g.805769  ORF g.805769 m.805769 type:complete len:139 (+) comp23375_c0_seq6:102-518(+)